MLIEILYASSEKPDWNFSLGTHEWCSPQNHLPSADLGKLNSDRRERRTTWFWNLSDRETNLWRKDGSGLWSQTCFFPSSNLFAKLEQQIRYTMSRGVWKRCYFFYSAHCVQKELEACQWDILWWGGSHKGILKMGKSKAPTLAELQHFRFAQGVLTLKTECWKDRLLSAIEFSFF